MSGLDSLADVQSSLPLVKDVRNQQRGGRGRGRNRGNRGRGGRGRGGSAGGNGGGEVIWEPLPEGVCYYFANGMPCPFQERCRYQHVIPGVNPRSQNIQRGRGRGRFHSGAYRGRSGRGGRGARQPHAGPSLGNPSPLMPQQSSFPTHSTFQTEEMGVPSVGNNNNNSNDCTPTSESAQNAEGQSTAAAAAAEEGEEENKAGKPRRRQPKKRRPADYFVRQRKMEKECEEELVDEHKEKEPGPFAAYNARGQRSRGGRPYPRRWNPKTRMKRSLVKDETLKELRDTELEIMKKKFPKYKDVIGKNVDGNDVFLFEFSSTDPDWPFDVTSITIQISFPPEYPLNQFRVEVTDPDDELPPLLVRHINRGMNAWLTEQKDALILKDIVETVFRPFTLWLDRNLEQLFIGGLKAVRMDIQARNAGISLHVPTFNKQNENSSEDDNDEEEDENSGTESAIDGEERSDDDDDDDEDDSDDNSSGSSDDADEEVDGSDGAGGGTLQKLKPGDIEIRVTAETGQNIASYQLTKFTFMLQCVRCHRKEEAPPVGCSLTQSHGFGSSCPTCGLVQKGSISAMLVHENSKVLGRMQLDGCVPIDAILMTCDFSVTCLHCNGQVPCKGLSYGQIHKTWCNNCNSKLDIRVDALRFHTPVPFDHSALLAKTGGATRPTKKDRNRDPRIKEGLPLPDTGTCKHYKKSFRWFRFPCCGRVYPCDECHEEANTDSHEMKLANRIICGFCAKEQPYVGTKGCIGCGGAVVKVRTTHWEGGKGCRNTKIMSAGDKKKYTGKNKTLSNHAKELLKAKQKKKKKKQAAAAST